MKFSKEKEKHHFTCEARSASSYQTPPVNSESGGGATVWNMAVRRVGLYLANKRLLAFKLS